MSGLIDTTLSSLHLENKLFLTVSPTILVGVLSIGSRITMGAMALSCKGVRKVVDYFDTELSENLDELSDYLLSCAKNDFYIELKVAAGLTALMVTGLGVATILARPGVLDQVKISLGLELPPPLPPPSPSPPTISERIVKICNDSTKWLSETLISLAREFSWENAKHTAYWIKDTTYWVADTTYSAGKQIEYFVYEPDISKLSDEEYEKLLDSYID